MTNSMSGNHSEKEREHKERIKKLKARTSKMRIANIKKWNKMTDNQKKNTYSSYSGISPEHVDLTGMGYDDLPKHVKKGVSKSAASTFKKSPSKPDDFKVTLGDKQYTMAEFEDHMASTDRPTYSGEIPGAADKLRKQRAKTKKAMKRNKSDFTKILQDDHPYKRKKDHPDDMNTRENRAYNTNQLAIKHQKETPLSRREKQNIADAENRERGQRAQPVRERHS